MKTIDVLKDSEISYIKSLVNKLNTDGICSDEDKIGISSCNIERWDDSCTDFLKKYGLNEKSLFSHGKFYKNHGAVYVLFNDERHTYESATEYMDTIVKNSSHN